MPGIRFTPAAAVDISGIWDYSAGRWGAFQADLYIRQMGGYLPAAR